jgi:uncharacterized protein with PIN domain
MHRATLRFYGDLTDFLPPARKGASFEQELFGAPSVKDVIESLGVPHPEVGLVLANGDSVDFEWSVSAGARVSVFPAFTTIDVGRVSRVRPELPERLRFVLDVHLGKLARYLRMAGFDALWHRDARDDELARSSASECRVLLTRDVGLLKRREVIHGSWIRATDPARQLTEVAVRYRLARHASPFSRCVRCNVALRPVPKDEVAASLPERVRAGQDSFQRCSSCGRVYWAGTHVRRMRRILEAAFR